MAGIVRFDMVVVFFVYGLAFFSMGLLLLVEGRRSPSLVEARQLWPLTFFGFVHGFHEWFEMGLELGKGFGLGSPAWLPIFRVVMLAISFAALLYFGLLALQVATQRSSQLALGIEVGFIGLYVLLILLTSLITNGKPAYWLEHADILARYTLAVPGAALTGIALVLQRRRTASLGRKNPRMSLQLAAACFVLYGLTQLVVAPLDMFPARYLNTAFFLNLFGFPIQIVRAAVAVGITAGLIRASQIAEGERQRQFISVQQERLQALEQVQRDLVEREALRRELLRHTVIAQEEERARIARELHDETAQFLTALSLNLATLRKSLPESTNLRELLDRLQALSGQMARGVYRMVHDLRPAQLDDLGLVAALQHLAEEERRRSGLRVSLEIKSPKTRLDPLVETVLFRIAQEALNNVARHSQSDQATIRLETGEKAVVLQVQDSGAGFALNKIAGPPHGYGLAGMNERAESVGGQFHIQSSIGQGTLVEVIVPMLVQQSSSIEEAAHEYHPLDIS